MSNTPVSRSERIIDQVLAEAGLEDADDLRPVLRELHALTGDQPQPSPEVLALMSRPSGAAAADAPTTVMGHAAAPTTVMGHAAADDAFAGEPDTAAAADTTVIDLAARRRNKRRLPLTALGVAVALAAGGGAAAAADQGVRDTLHEALSSIAATFGSTQGQQQPAQDDLTSGQSGTFQTPQAPAHSTPSTTPDNGKPADGQHQDNEGTPGADDTGSGRSGSQWLSKNTPSIPGTGQGTPSELPVPEVTAPDVPLPTVPNLPASQHGDGREPQP